MHRKILDNYDTIALILALLILPMVGLEFFSHVPGFIKNIFEGYYVLVYALFVIELVARFFFSTSKVAYFKKNWIQIFIVIFPFLHLVAIAPVLEGVFLIAIERITRRFIKPHHYSVVSVLIFLVMIVFVSTELILFFEKPYQASQIKTFSDALWWSTVGISTIGIGNVVPSSPAGKVLTLCLMMVGIIFLSMVIANISSIFTEEDIRKDIDHELRQIEGDLNKVEKDVENEVATDDKLIENKVEELEDRIERLEKRK